MIQSLDNHRRELAKEMWGIQIPAYQTEADLMGFEEIPQLKETVEDIQASNECFIGFFDDGLKGFISYKEEEKLIDIYRLVIHPDFFRQGIARQLLSFLLEQFPGYNVTVSTGKANIPAKKLYHSFGFVEQNDFEVAPGIWCTEFSLTT